MSTDYFVQTFSVDRSTWIDELQRAIDAEVTNLGIHRSVRVQLIRDSPDERGPSVGVYLGSHASATDQELCERITLALAMGMPVIPVVASLDDFSSQVPSLLRPMNGWEWGGSEPAVRLARRVLEELGVEDRRRRVFISHKRDDGLAVAEQLHDFLLRHGFAPFIDRFGVGIGKDVQNEIADALEDCAFLLLLETPLAHTSEWVFDEVEYALSHQMGMHIVAWPGDVSELPGTNRLPRHHLQASDLTLRMGYDVITDAALDVLLADIEAIHANTLVRRRRYLLRSAEDAVLAAGLKCLPIEGWRLLVNSPTGGSVVQVTARLPTVDDLRRLDDARLALLGGDYPGVLVHSARMLQPERRDTLVWAAGARDLTMVPENAIGGYWD